MSRQVGVVVVVVLGCQFSEAQVCRLSVAGLNQSRRVTGQIHAECPEELIHSVPWGNFGVTSNFGHKGNSHQFDGWCHDTRICDASGLCHVACTDGWYEWNSCTDNAAYAPPNCSYFNAANCTEQASTTGVNVHGTKYVDIPVRCPSDTNGDGIPDQGGCADVRGYSSGANFLSLYELDPACCDALVQTVYFRETTVPLSCDVFGCGAKGGPWLDPVSWDSPASPPKVFAQMAMVVNWGGFVDAAGVCRVSLPTLNVVSAASFEGPNVAPDSIAAIFGDQLAPIVAEADTIPLPTAIAGFSMKLTDRAGTQRPVPLFYISPRQVNFLVPAGTVTGAASLSIYSGEVLRSTARLQIDAVAPAVFTQNSSGSGVPAAIAVRVGSGGNVSVEPVSQCASGVGSCVPVPLDVGPGSGDLYLVLFGTGIRGRSDPTAVSVVIGGATMRVDYAGPQNQYVGLDQVNVYLPPELAGRGSVDVVLTVDSKPANTVQIAFR